MSKIAWMLVLATACGGGNKAKDDAPTGGGSDASTPVCTAPPVVPVAACTPTSGSTVSTRMIGQVSGGTVNTYNTFQSGRADKSQTYGSVGFRLGF